MLRIRLTRTGKRNQPRYRIVVKEKRSKLGGTYVDLLGFYDPTQNPKVIKIGKKKYAEWIEKGAQPTATVRSFVK